MNDMHFRKDVLIEALKKAIANVSISIEKGCKDPDKLKNYTEYYIAISLKAYYSYYNKYKSYTRCEMALKEYNMLYIEAFREAIESNDNIARYLDPALYNDTECEDERFIILAMLNLSSFITSNNINKTKHLFNTYIPKIRSSLKNLDKYVSFFSASKHTTMAIKTALFRFLVENG